MALEYGFDDQCSARFKRIVRSEMYGHKENKRVTWLTQNVLRFAEQDGGNIGNGFSQFSNGTVTTEIDRQGYAVMWIWGNAIVYNRASRATEQEIRNDVRILIRAYLGGK